MGHPHHADTGNNEFFKRQLKPPEVLMGAPGVSHSWQLPTQDANHSTQKDGWHAESRGKESLGIGYKENSPDLLLWLP